MNIVPSKCAEISDAPSAEKPNGSTIYQPYTSATDCKARLATRGAGGIIAICDLRKHTTEQTIFFGFW